MKKTCKACGKIGSMFSWEDECYSCKRKSYRNELKRRIASGEVDSTDCESEIFCPYCGQIYEIDDAYELYEEGDHEVYCGNCDKNFRVTTNVSYHYDTERMKDSHE